MRKKITCISVVCLVFSAIYFFIINPLYHREEYQKIFEDEFGIQRKVISYKPFREKYRDIIQEHVFKTLGGLACECQRAEQEIHQNKNETINDFIKRKEAKDDSIRRKRDRYESARQAADYYGFKPMNYKVYRCSPI